MITKKQTHAALITALITFNLSYHQVLGYGQDGQQDNEGQKEILIFSEGSPELKLYLYCCEEQNANLESDLLSTSELHRDLGAFVQLHKSTIEEALLASESAQQGETLLAYNEKKGEWEEILSPNQEEGGISEEHTFMYSGAYDGVHLAFNLIKGAIVVSVALSWLAPRHPGTLKLVHMLSPLLAPARQITKHISTPLDFSPMLTFLVIQAIQNALPRSSSF